MTRPCLYCGDPAIPKSDEHVLQKGLGGCLILKDDVCTTCNSVVFAALDGELIKVVREFVCYGHPDVGRGRSILQSGLQLARDESENVWTTIRVDKNFTPMLLDQIILAGPGRVLVTMDPRLGGDPTARLQRMLDELQDDPGSLALEPRVVQHVTPPVEPALARSAPRTYVVRGAHQTEVDALTERVRSGRLGWSAQNASGRTDQEYQPLVQVVAGFDVGSVERAAAKVAMNFVCHALGPEVTRGPAFDATRKFVMMPYDRSNGSPVRLHLDGQEEPGPEDQSGLLCQPDHHAIALRPAPDRIVCDLMLYQRLFATVSVEGASIKDWAVGVFDYKAKRARVITARAMKSPVEDWRA